MHGAREKDRPSNQTQTHSRFVISVVAAASPAAMAL